MSALKKTTGASILLLTVAVGGNALAQSTLLFSNGWESGSGTGCDFTKLTDRSAWNDYGPAATCGSPPVAEIVTNEKFEGTSSLRVNFTPDGSGNGPDFRIVKSFGANRNEIYARWYTKWSNNWVWATADHKVAIFGSGNQSSQDVYYNIRGNSGGGPTGRVVIHVTPSNTALSDPSFVVTPGVWHLCEIRIVSGANGRIEAKMDGRLLNLQREAGNSANASNLNTGAGVGYIKLDTTYNAYSFPSGRGLYMNMWYDSVAVGTAGWIGGTVPGGGAAPPSYTPPSAPINLTIVR
ncbi:MAG: hypothetical protein AB7N65_00790 [Vicinamibacterales bacterium]